MNQLPRCPCAQKGPRHEPSRSDRVVKTDAEWQADLTAEEYRILRKAGTERAFTGKYHDHKEAGTYACICCGTELFTSDEKYDSGSGWPSFYQPAKDDVIAELYQKDLKDAVDRAEAEVAAAAAELERLEAGFRVQEVERARADLVWPPRRTSSSSAACSCGRRT